MNRWKRIIIKLIMKLLEEKEAADEEGQAVKLRNGRDKFHQTTYKAVQGLFSALYMGTFCTYLMT